MWWPALGAIVVGVVGYLDPRTLGVGYQYIEEILAGRIVGTTLVLLVVLKFVSWSIYLGSGTSGGTLAPLFIIGGGLGAILGSSAAHALPALGVSPSVAALVGMAAVFAGASHALLTSIVFAFEATRQPLGLLPLLAGCSAAYLVSTLLMRTSIMTEKLARRGADVRSEYTVDYLSQVLVRDAMTREVVTLEAGSTLGEVREWLSRHAPGSTHQGFPILEQDDTLVGVITRRDLFDDERSPTTPIGELVRRPPAVAYESNSLREAADHMVREGVGRLAVVDRETGRMVGILSRSDLLSAHEDRLHAADRREQSFASRPATA
jgi:CBS domain-containing protein